MAVVKFAGMNETNGRPLILVVNDDGIFAGGIKALSEVMVEFGDVIVIAPDKPQSGMGHAVTLNTPLRLNKVDFEVPVKAAYSCSGTPVDAVKLAMAQVMPRKPDLLVSGINHGANHSINVMYSGTMSAALEGTVEGIPSIGFSLLDHSLNANFKASKEIVRKIVSNAIQHGIPDGICMNVNIPAVALDELKGIRVCRQARALWVDEFEERTDPIGRKYYWMTGEFKSMDAGEDSDVLALENNFVSVVPVQLDLTGYAAFAHFQQWKF